MGVGIDRQFYARFQDAWDGGDTHAPDLLGTGDAMPKPRRFYKPEVWAGQLDAYVREVIGEPCVLVSQGGLLPVALEMMDKAFKNKKRKYRPEGVATLHFGFVPAEEGDGAATSTMAEEAADGLVEGEPLFDVDLEAPEPRV